MADQSSAIELRMRWVHVPTGGGGFRAERCWIPVPTKALPLPVADAAQPDADAVA